MILEELLIPIKLDGADKKSLDEIDRLLGLMTKMAQGALTLAAGMTAASTAVSAFVLSVSKSIEDVGRSAEVLGMSTDMLDKWNTVANLATGRTKGMAGEMQAFGTILSQIARGRAPAAARALGMLNKQGFGWITDPQGGLKPTNEVLLDVASALRKIEDPARRIDIAESLGLGGVLPLLMKGGDEIQRMLTTVEAIGVATDEDKKTAAELMMSWRLFGRVLASVGRLIATTIAPYLNEILRYTVEWYAANKDLLKSELVPFLRSLGKFVAVFWRAIFQAVRFTNALVSATVRWQNVLRVVVVSLTLLLALLTGAAIAAAILSVGKLVTLMTALSTAIWGANAAFVALAGKITVVLVVLAAIALVLEDIWTTMEGGEGLIDSLVQKKIPLLSRALAILLGNLRMILATVKAVSQILFDPFNMENWKDALNTWQKDWAPGFDIFKRAALFQDLATPATTEVSGVTAGALAGGGGGGGSSTVVSSPNFVFNITGVDLSKAEDLRRVVELVIGRQMSTAVDTLRSVIAK